MTPGEWPELQTLRRVSRAEYAETVGGFVSSQTAEEVDIDAGEGHPPEPALLGFTNNRELAEITPQLLDFYATRGGQVAVLLQDAVPRGSCVTPDAPTWATRKCTDSFLQDVAVKLFGQPLGQEGTAVYAAAFDAELQATGDLASARQIVLQAMLLSPRFLLRAETGSDDAPLHGPMPPLTNWEIATRLSWFLWRAPYDEALHDAILGGEDLSDPAVRGPHVARMLADPRAHQTVVAFLREWLGITRRPDDTWFAAHDMPPEVLESFDRFVERQVFGGDGRLESLLSGDELDVTPTLMVKLGYGVEDMSQQQPPTRLAEGCQLGTPTPEGVGTPCTANDSTGGDDPCPQGLHCLSMLSDVWSWGAPSVCVDAAACADTQTCGPGTECLSFRSATAGEVAACVPQGCIARPSTVSDLQTGWFRVRSDQQPRHGLLAHPALLQAHGDPDDRFLAPIRRGRMIRQQLLCSQVAPPPPNIPNNLPEEGVGGTVREELAQHWEDPFCASCHLQMDLIGFAFENYDALGVWRDVDSQGRPIDASGEVVGVEDAGEPFVGVGGLNERLLDSEQVRLCLVRQWFRYAYGRLGTAADEADLTALEERFAASDGDILDLVVALTESDAMLSRYPSEEAAGGL